MTDPTPLSRERAIEIVAACGADPRRWPADARAALLALAGDPEIAAALAEARRLDALLDDWAAVPVDSAIDAAAIARRPQPRPARRLGWFAGGALAAAVAAGLVVLTPVATDRSPIAAVPSATAVAATGGDDAAFAYVFTPTPDEEDLI